MELRNLGRHSDWITAMDATADLRWAVSASRDGTLKLWDVELGLERSSLAGHGRGVTVAAMTPDAWGVVSACEDGRLRVWDVASGGVIASFYGDAWLTSCAVAPDGIRIAAGDWSGRIHLLRLKP